MERLYLDIVFTLMPGELGEARGLRDCWDCCSRYPFVAHAALPGIDYRLEWPNPNPRCQHNLTQ